MKLLVLHKGGIGDVVFALPFFEDLKRGFPDAHLTVITHDQGQELLAFAPPVDRALGLGPVSRGWRLRDAQALIAGERFDIALTTARSPRAALLLWRSGARTRVGFSGGPEALLYTHRAPSRPVEVVFSRRFERLAHALDIVTSESAPRLKMPPFARERGRALLRAQGWSGVGPLVALHVGGGWPTKRWPTEYAARLAGVLHQASGSTILLQGGPDDAARGREVQALAPPGTVVNTAGSCVRDALAQAAVCDAAIGVDSGLSHATGALGIPTVYLFGPNDPRSVRWASHQAVLTEGLPCQPCNRAGRDGCPLKHHRCMRNLDVDRVAAAVLPRLVPASVGPAEA